jgi:hypothetical protein
MGKKTSNVSDKVISFGKILIEFAKQCDYVYSETNNIYTYGLDIVTRKFILGDKYASIFSLEEVGKHNWEISYWKSYKDEDLSYHYFKDNEMDYNKEVSRWTKYIQNFSKKMKKKSIFEREQKMKEDF